MSDAPQASRGFQIEVCCGSLEAARTAQIAGADRIELNSALELDGLTPSAGLLELVMNSIQIPIIAMARPRAGNFNYSDFEWQTLVHDAKWLLNQGVAGIAFGCLDENNDIALDRCKEMRSLTTGKKLVFHKAFDDVRDPRKSLEQLVEVGIDRVMTSGHRPTALDGLTNITSVHRQAEQRIEILPAGGINAQNAKKIAQTSGCRQLHGSFSSGKCGNLRLEIEQTISELTNLSFHH